MPEIDDLDWIRPATPTDVKPFTNEGLAEYLEENPAPDLNQNESGVMLETEQEKEIRKMTRSQLRFMGFEMGDNGRILLLKHGTARIGLDVGSKGGFDLKFDKEIEPTTKNKAEALVEKARKNGLNAFPMFVRTPVSETATGNVRDDFALAIDDPKMQLIKGDYYLVLIHQVDQETKQMQPDRWVTVPKSVVGRNETDTEVFGKRLYFK